MSSQSGRILTGAKVQSSIDETTLGEFFFNRSDEFENNICQIDASTDESETYSSVKKRSIRLAIALRRYGVTSKDVIAICSQNSIDTTIPVVATFFLGAKIANLDPTLSAKHVTHLLSLVAPKIMFVEDSSLNLIEQCIKETKMKNMKIVVFGKSDQYLKFSDLVKPDYGEENFELTPVDPHDTAIMFFSSGTTGLPKAICHSHYSFLRLTEIGESSFPPIESILYFTTFYWISAMIMLTQTYSTGGTRIFSRNMDGENTLTIIEKYKVSAVFMAPIYTYKLTNVENFDNYDLSSLRFILTGGTGISPEQFKKLDKYFENADILFGYGMTEIGFVTVFDVEKDKYLIKTKIGSCGKVAKGAMIKVVDVSTQEILGPNEKGEIRVKSLASMKGYHNQDSTDCFDKDGFLKTGDIGYYDEDDCFYVVERIKEMFKYQSWHIVPSSIEAVLMEHPAISECVVFGIPKGEEGEVPAACIVLKDDHKLEKEEIEKFLNERVADREKLRGGIFFVDVIQKTPSGKAMRKEVRNEVIKRMEIAVT